MQLRNCNYPLTMIPPKKNLLIKAEDTTDPKYGCIPSERPIKEYLNKGVVNIDKPAGPTSHEVSSYVKKILNINKAGHSGTLDPKVTGSLPIMLEDATKCVGALLTSEKEYVCLMKLHKGVEKNKIREVCQEFVGAIYQKPPIKSAIKRQIRVRKIYYLDILEIEDTKVLFKVGCEAGTYIRKLVHDIGQALGIGAHMQELRRTKTGPFTEETIVTLHDLKDAYVYWQEENDESFLREVIHPMEIGLSHLPSITIKDSAVDAICHGASLAVPGILSLESKIKKGDLVAVFTLKGEAVSLGIALMASEKILNSDTGMAVTTSRVLMEPKIYPKVWKLTS